MFTFDGQSVACDMLGEGEPAVLVDGTPLSPHEWRNIPGCKDEQEVAPGAVVPAALRFFHPSPAR